MNKFYLLSILLFSLWLYCLYKMYFLLFAKLLCNNAKKLKFEKELRFLLILYKWHDHVLSLAQSFRL